MTWGMGVVSAAVVLTGLVAAPSHADNADPWDYDAYECLTDRFNPLDDAGVRTGTDPVPGTPEWAAFDDSHVACTDQRDSDRNQHFVPDSPRSAVQYGTDPYRDPALHDGKRFRFEQFGTQEIGGVPSAEGYRPCQTDECDLPDELSPVDGPYPVVVLMHGVVAQDIHHRFNTQTFAENGYLAIGVDGYGAGYVPGLAGPNVQRCDNARDVLDWLATPASGEWGQLADLSRVAIVGHSQGSQCALGYQGDPRVDAIIAWDGGDAISAANCTTDQCVPVMFQRTDGGFSTASSYAGGYPATRDRGAPTFAAAQARGVDMMHLTMRDTVHTDWNGYGTGLAGNRYFELASNYYNVAWLDRHLKGELVLDASGAVVTSDGRDEAQERGFRQAQAQDAFDRLTSKRFLSGTVDKHNISMGFWDADKAAAAGDLLWGGNVPYSVEGTFTLDRLSPFYRSFCTISVPDYVSGSGSVATAQGSDLRLGGCLSD